MATPRSRPFLIRETSIKGFKSLEDLKVTIQPGLNILIGKNGAGKSNFLEALYGIISSIYTGNIGFKNGSILLEEFGADRVIYTIDKPNAKNVNNVEDIGEINDTYQQKLFINDKVVFDNQDFENREFKFDGRTIKSGNNLRLLLRRLGIRFSIPKYVRFDTPANTKGVALPTSLSLSLTQEYEYDFDYQSSLIIDTIEKFVDTFYEEIEINADLELEQRLSTAFNKLNIEKILKGLELDSEVINNLLLFTPIKDLRFNNNISFYKNDTHLIIDNLKLDFFVNDNWLPWSQLSDGTKRLFFIVTDVTLNRGNITLLEEPELGVHPHQLNSIMQFLKEQSDGNQIIISTHSPKALDILASDELDRIMIAEYQRGRGTQITRMTKERRQKAAAYMEEVGFLSDYWLLSDLEG